MDSKFNRGIMNKYQLTCYDISGRVYKQGLYSTTKRAFSAQKRASERYGAYLRFKIDPVPLEQKKPIAVVPIDNQYCFCPETHLSVDKCPKCGKKPYTD